MLNLFRYQELKLAKQETRIRLTQSNFYTLIISLFVFLVTYPILNNLNTIACHATRPKHYLTNHGNNKNHHASRQQRAVYMAIENQPTARVNSSESLASSWFYQQDQPVILDQCCACDEAKYELVFEGLWSKYTHPDDFPENYWQAYFSDIIGASHSNDFRMWGQGTLASDGVRELAETGATKKLEFELKQVSSKTRTIIKARELRYPTLNSKTSAVFRTDKHHHLVSILSKLGPSPDWMVGVSGLELCQLDCTWAAQRIVNLYLWDAGTDSGSTFTSSDEPTRPQEPIHSYRRSSAAQLSSQTNATMRSMFDANNSNFDQVLSQFKNQQQQRSDQSGPSVDEMQTTQSGDAPFMVSPGSSVTANANSNNLAMDGFNNEYIKPFARLTVTRQRIYEKSCNGGDPISSYSSPYKPTTTLNQHSHHNQHDQHQQHNLQSHYRQAMDAELAYDSQPMKPPVVAVASYSDCRFTDWTDWSSCSSTCGKGIRTRTRSHLDDQADLAGCSKADLIEKEVCLSDCVANTTCVTRDWSEWSKCSVDCGQGYRKRTRSPIGQMKPVCGSIELVETEQCVGSCGQDEQPASHCAVTEWSEWSECPVACGTGTKIRFRQFVRKEDAKNCNVKLIQKQSCTGRPELCNQVSKEACMKKPEVGLCKAHLIRWYYSDALGKCQRFVYGGCGGNENNFKTIHECHKSCVQTQLDSAKCEHSCMLASDRGTCSANRRRYYYDKSTGQCEEFDYGGCDGNENNFKSRDECQSRCAASCSICLLSPHAKNSCRRLQLHSRWFYNKNTGTCEESQCQSKSKNSFATRGECLDRCGAWASMGSAGDQLDHNQGTTGEDAKASRANFNRANETFGMIE